MEGLDLTLTCSATGSPPPSYRWIRLDKQMPSKARGVNTQTLVIPKVGWNDIGVYACVAVNEGGNAQSRPIYVILQGRTGSSFSNTPGSRGMYVQAIFSYYSYVHIEEIPAGIHTEGCNKIYINFIQTG